MTFKTNIDNQVRGFYYASSGNDSFSGQTLEIPKLTMQAAINAAAALSPTAGNLALVTAAQGGSFAENIVMSDFVQLNGEDTSLTTSSGTTVVLASGARFRLVNTSNSGTGDTFIIAGKTNVGLFCGRCDVTTGTALNISGTVSDVFVNFTDLDIVGVGGTGISVTSTNTIPLDINVDICQLEANNTTFMDYNAALTTSECVIRVSSIDTSLGVTGTTAFLVRNGVLEVEVSGHIESETAITVQSGATLRIGSAHITGTITVESGGLLQINAIAATGNITVNSGGTMEATIINHSGTITNNGTLNGNIAGVDFGTYVGDTVSKVGTPVDNQIAVWTAANIIEGTTNLIFTGTLLETTGQIKSTLSGLGSTSGLIVDSVNASLSLRSSSAAVDEKTYCMSSTGGQFVFKTVNDANSATQTFFLVNRTGITVDDITFTAPQITFTTPQLIVSGVMKLSNGTELLPSYSFTNATNYGMRFDSSGSALAFSNNGFDVLKLTADANAANFLNINASADVAGEGDVRITTGGTSTDMALFLDANFGVNLNTVSGSGDVEMGVGTVVRVQSVTPSVGIGVSAFTPTTGELLRLQDAASGATRTRLNILSPVNSNILTMGINQTSIDSGSAFITNETTNALRLSTSAGEALGLVDQNVVVGTAAPLSDMTLFQKAGDTTKGLTFSGVPIGGSEPGITTEGVSIFAGNLGAANNQLWIVNTVDQGDSSKNSFRFLTGIDVPLIVGVNNTNSANRNLCFGINSLGAGIAVGFPTSTVQADVDAKLHVKTGVAAEIGFIVQGETSQTADLFQAKNIGDTVLVSIAADGQLQSTKSGDGPDSGIHISSTLPAIAFNETDAAVDNRLWDIIATSEQLLFRAVNDANSASEVFLVVERTAQVIDEVVFPNGPVRITENLGVGAAPVTQLHVTSSAADTTGIIRAQSIGTNPGVTTKFVGNRDPNGNITGAGGDEYYRDSADTSGTYESFEATTGTAWFKRRVLPSAIIEINTAAEFEALATASVITISASITLIMNITVVTSSLFVINAGFALAITGQDANGIGITYIGTGTLFSGSGSVVVDAGITLASGSTGVLQAMTPSSDFERAIYQNCTIAGWVDLGTQVGGSYACRFVSLVSIGSGWTLTDLFVAGINNVAIFGVPLATPFYTIDSKRADTAIRISTMQMTLSSTGSVVDISSKLSDGAKLFVDNVVVTAGSVFKPSVLTDATISSVADGSLAAGTITAMADNSASGTTISSTTTYLEDEIVTITGTTSYNGTFRIFNVVASTSFDIQVAFVADDATGAVNSDRLTITLAGGHGISTGDDLKIIDTNFYNGFVTSLLIATNTLTVNGSFVSTNTGSIERELSLDQSDPRVSASALDDFSASTNIACAHVNDNGTANGAIVNDTFTDMVFGTVADALIASSTMERWRLTDELNGTFEYIGREPFEGLITFDFTVTSSGGTVDFRFKWQHDIGSGFVDLADNVEALVAVGSDAQSVTKTFPLTSNRGDLIKPQITRNSGTSGITTMYATVYATG